MMNIQIGVNIKRFRQQKDITQEKFAEYMNVSAPAVSKWERGETLPDISMILPIASFFGVSTDELLGYDKAAVEMEIQKRIAKMDELWAKGKYKENEEVLLAALHDFPNDFRILVTYMHHLVGGRTAESSQEKILSHAEELLAGCRRILDECTTNGLRFEAAHIMAIVYKAQGEIDKAIACFDDFPSWWSSKEQHIEQLFPHGTEEWLERINVNIVTLGCGALQKYFRTLWLSDKTFEEKDRLSELLAEQIKTFCAEAGYESTKSILGSIYHEGGKYSNMEKRYDTAAKYYEKYLECSADSAASATWLKNAPFFTELRKTEAFQAVLAKY
ncbi:MAG: helix-turn-helix domain-containing protein [Oscillospiraceae bacterium]|nr:helix-turn-helix domain-containing protein [Oscillospiraceae bacterium]